ncbi:hypothetical protein RRG08_059984 [Elysia crispata]|uniref:Uncharacterized protein n=1 Tax=Elysia crispata TaxID=231223 RepID=A0AAE1AKU2_9GAST|nr:hypothetical protein RRG08_059984 [Elysia crispata]
MVRLPALVHPLSILQHAARMRGASLDLDDCHFRQVVRPGVYTSQSRLAVPLQDSWVGLDTRHTTHDTISTD